jgi:hypothetical protein
MYIEGIMTLEDQEEFCELGWEIERIYPETNPEVVSVCVENFSLAEVLSLFTQIEDEEMDDESESGNPANDPPEAA